MKTMKLLYLKNCPYCRQAFQYIQELKQENPKYLTVNIQMIEESEEVEIANALDYWYVPCFYIDEEKVHEGVVRKDEVKAILDQMV